MEELLTRQRKGKPPKEIEELYLDNVHCSGISGLTDDYANLKKLSLVNNDLTSLNGLPFLPHLQWLSLNDNKLTGKLETVLYLCPQVSYIGLAGNKITDVAELKPLAKLDNLTSLDLYNCPVTQQKSYREQVFSFLPKLKALDGMSLKGEEIPDSNEGDEEDGSSDEDSGNDIGLDYLTKDLGSESSDDEEDYDPDQDEVSDEDDVGLSDDEEGAGPSVRKRPRLDLESETHASDSSNSD